MMWLYYRWLLQQAKIYFSLLIREIWNFVTFRTYLTFFSLEGVMELYCEVVGAVLWGCRCCIVRLSVLYCEGVGAVLWGCRCCTVRVSVLYCEVVGAVLWGCRCWREGQIGSFFYSTSTWEIMARETHGKMFLRSDNRQYWRIKLAVTAVLLFYYIGYAWVESRTKILQCRRRFCVVYVWHSTRILG